nr:hypothetical protein [Luteitalea sp.]
MPDSVAFERVPQHGFAHRPKLRQRAIAAAVLRRRPRLEARHSHDVEREVHHALGTSQKESRAPVRGAEDEAPLRNTTVPLEEAHLEETDGRGLSSGHDRETGIATGRALTVGPGNEGSKPVILAGGGEMKRVTSSGVKWATSDGASDATSSRSVNPRPDSTGSDARQSTRETGSGASGSTGAWLTFAWWGINSMA